MDDKDQKISIPTNYFEFDNNDDIFDLKEKALIIKQNTLFKPKEGDEEEVIFEIYEITAGSFIDDELVKKYITAISYAHEKKSTRRNRDDVHGGYEVLRIVGKVKKEDKYNIRIEKIEQDPNKLINLPKYQKIFIKNALDTPKFKMTSNLKILGVDGKQRGLGEDNPKELEFICPPLEYGGTREFQMGAMGHIDPEKHKDSHQILVTWGNFYKMLEPYTIDNKKFIDKLRQFQDNRFRSTRKSGFQFGTVRTVVIHCTSAIKKLTDPDQNNPPDNNPKNWFDLDDCLNTWYFTIHPEGWSPSAHFAIDRDGTIIQCHPINRLVHHAPGGGNTRGIGIELIGLMDKSLWRGKVTNGREYLINKYCTEKKEIEDEKKSQIEENQRQIDSYKEVLDERKERDDDEIIILFEGKDNEETTTIGNANNRVKDAIKELEDKNKEIEKELANLILSEWAQEYEEVTNELASPDLIPNNVAIDRDGKEGTSKKKVPLVFAYTQSQYDALGKLLEVIGKRYGYERVCTHHWINRSEKFDPGIFFKWDLIINYLLPGEFNNKTESEDGGLWTVK